MPETGSSDSDDVHRREGAELSSWLTGTLRSADSSALEAELVLDFEDVSPVEADETAFDVVATTAAGRTVAFDYRFDGHEPLDRTLASASKLDPDLLVVTGTSFADDHLKTLRWLNDATHATAFAVALDASGDDAEHDDLDSTVRLDVQVEPPGWTDQTERDLTEKQTLQRRYWAELRDRIERRDTCLETREPQPNNWYNNSMGEIGYTLQFAINSHQRVMLTQLVVRDDPDGFRSLAADREAIECEIGAELVWLTPDEAKGESNRARITLRREGDLFAEETWPEYQAWMLDAGEQFYEAFRDRI